jgi:predicted unusual protein kinase regulating ubiquinone biosynthesis (AarF/ABC1/UbiB family)
LRRFRLYRIVSVALVIFTVAWRYWWLQRRKRATQAQWDRAHAKTGAAIYRLATRLGGAFVKHGQVLGARADVLPAPVVAPLRGLHEPVPPRPFAKLRDHVEREDSRSRSTTCSRTSSRRSRRVARAGASRDALGGR